MHTPSSRILVQEAVPGRGMDFGTSVPRYEICGTSGLCLGSCQDHGLFLAQTTYHHITMREVPRAQNKGGGVPAPAVLQPNMSYAQNYWQAKRA